MGFMDNLIANPKGSGIYGQVPQQNDNDSLSIVNRLKDREMQDFKDKANFMSDLSLRQEQRMRNLYDPAKADAHQNPNIVMGPDKPSAFPIEGQDAGLTPEQKVNKYFQQQELDQKNKFGQEGLDIKSQQEKLNQQKSDQINTNKQNDLQRKIDEADGKLDLAQKALQQKTDNAADQLVAHKALADAVEERHKAEMALKEHQFAVTSESHQRQIDDLEKKLKSQEHTSTTTEVNADGTKKTTTTNRGDAAETIQVTGKDGKIYTIPKDKINDTDSDGTPHWKPVGGGGDDNNVTP